MNKDTKLVSLGRDKKFTGSAVNPRLVRTSTVVFDSLAQMHSADHNKDDGVEYYGRRGTSTTFAFCEAMCSLENAAGCYVYPCGTAAITSALLSFLSAGDHLLMVDSVYEPTRNFCTGSLARLGVEVSFYDPLLGGGLKSLIKSNTKVIFMESPGSLSMEVQDVPAIAELARRHNIVSMIDNTYATPINFTPLDVGVDICIHSATKYISGHSDVMLGVASANETCWPILQKHSYELGQCASVDDIYTSLRGLRTLGVRMREHDKNARTVARHLSNHDLVERVLHPAFDACDGYEIFDRDYHGGNGLFSLVLKHGNANAMAAMLDGMHHFKMGFSWGGFESLALPVDSSVAKRTSRPWNHTKMLRLHIGLENPQDLIEDLELGLARYLEALKDA